MTIILLGEFKRTLPGYGARRNRGRLRQPVDRLELSNEIGQPRIVDGRHEAADIDLGKLEGHLFHLS
jgi:hypothetical protein